MSVVVELLMVITNLIGSVNKRKKRKSISEKLGRPCYWNPYVHFSVVLLGYILNLFTCLLQFRSNYFKLPGLESNCV